MGTKYKRPGFGTRARVYFPLPSFGPFKHCASVVTAQGENVPRELRSTPPVRNALRELKETYFTNKNLDTGGETAPGSMTSPTRPTKLLDKLAGQALSPLASPQANILGITAALPGLRPPKTLDQLEQLSNWRSIACHGVTGSSPESTGSIGRRPRLAAECGYSRTACTTSPFRSHITIKLRRLSSALMHSSSCGNGQLGCQTFRVLYQHMAARGEGKYCPVSASRARR
jgi:hypothetical protein